MTLKSSCFWGLFCSILAFVVLLAPSARGETGAFETRQQFGSEDYSGKRIVALSIKNMDITDVLKIISDISNWNIVPSSKVKGQITLWVKDIDAGELLDSVVTVNGFAYTRERNTVLVMTKEEYEEQYGTKKEVFALKHAKASDVQAVLEGFLTKRGKVKADSQSNQLIIVDEPGNLEALRPVIEKIDRSLEVEVIDLKNARAEDVAEKLVALSSRSGKVQADERTNQLVLIDTAPNLERLKQIAIDLDRKDVFLTRTFPLKYADSASVRDMLRELFGLPEMGLPPEMVPGGAATPVPEGTSAISPTGLVTVTSPEIPPGITPPEAAPVMPGAIGPLGTIVADERTNTVIVTQTPEMMQKIEEIISSVDVPLESNVYQLNYADLERLGLGEKLAKILTRKYETFHIDEATKKVMFTCAPDRAEDVFKHLREWDVKAKQVFIEGKILSVSRDLLKDLGIHFEVFFGDGSVNVEIISDFPPSVLPAIPTGSIRITDGGIDALIKAVETDSRSKLLSSPRVLVLDDREAIFSVTTNEPYTEVVTDATTEMTREHVTFLPIGVVLTVAPHINEEEIITMDLRLEVSSLVEIREGIPVVDRSQAQSTVMIKNGSTIMIGGLIFDEEIEVENKVPFLGDIPLLGRLFKNIQVDKSKNELILLITPHIIGEEQKEPVPTLEEMSERVELSD